MPIPFGGDRVAVVSADLAEAFRAGDMLLVSQSDGALLHVPAIVRSALDSDVSGAVRAFAAMATTPRERVDMFFRTFAARLQDEDVWSRIAEANDRDLERAHRRGASTGRLALTASTRSGMIEGLLGWTARDDGAGAVSQHVHPGWRLDVVRAPLGVIGFVFEGRPNVFADAVGVLRTGNVAILKIGRDAHETATAMMSEALVPALAASDLPPGAVTLVSREERAAAWALFADRRLSLAVARGSGPAVTQLGDIARQSGVPASLHGTGGAWLVADQTGDRARFVSAVRHSLDRKVCNTLNVCCIVRSRATELVPLFLDELAAAARGAMPARVHVVAKSEGFVPASLFERGDVGGGAPPGRIVALPMAEDDLGCEWEWEGSPEISLVIVDGVEDAIALFNAFSPHFVASLVSDDPAAHEAFYAGIEAPFVGDGFTRWVDGQYALGEPELGLANWENGPPLGRGSILSGGGIFTLRYRMRQTDMSVRR